MNITEPLVPLETMKAQKLLIKGKQSGITISISEQKRMPVAIWTLTTEI
tara:strand:- start:289 stop:435 length:147 start_codon:yes stop_codon:yes gene_type:complete